MWSNMQATVRSELDAFASNSWLASNISAGSQGGAREAAMTAFSKSERLGVK
jgi:hypothetical protein